jgi:hypothetical protein
MAKQTALELVNKVLKNIGEPTVSALTSLSGISLLVFDTINEAIYDISHEEKFSLLEEDGTITLSTGIKTADIPSDMETFDKDSFRYDESRKIEYYSISKLDRNVLTQTNVGQTNKITLWKSLWYLDPSPNAALNAKTITYRYWEVPTILSTATPTGTCWIPQGFDLTMLCDYVTYKILHYKHNNEAMIYYTKVWGDGRFNEGSLARFKRLYASHSTRYEDIMQEPL